MGKKKKIDVSECVIEEDKDSPYTLKDVILQRFIRYVNENSEFTIERKFGKDEK